MKDSIIYLTENDVINVLFAFLFCIIVSFILSHSASALVNIYVQLVQRFKKKSTIENHSMRKQFRFIPPIIKGVKNNHGRKLPFNR